MLDDDALAPLLALAGRLADAAGQAALPWFRSAGLLADNKAGVGGFDPVTAADRAAEDAMRAILAAERPQDAILGEETGQTAGDSGLTWVIDPIDGTRAFMAGLPVWGVLVGLEDGEKGRIGIVDQPFVGERFIGVDWSAGGAAWVEHRGARRDLQVRACAALGDAVMLSTTPEMFTAGELERFDGVRRGVRLTRFGTDCYGYAMIAAGQADLVIESGLGPYDIVAPAVVLRAAGGIVTDWRGEGCRGGGQVVAAGDPRVHEAALEALNRSA